MPGETTASGASPETPGSAVRAAVEGDLRRAAGRVQTSRRRPLLVLYYPEQGTIIEDDARDVYEEFRRCGWSRERPRQKLDVLIHSLGGVPDAAYRVAQVVRDFAADVDILVPEYAWSAATLLCLAGDTIHMGAYATLGPIDVTVGPSEEEEIPLASIEYYKRFVADCLNAVLHTSGRHGPDWETRVDSKLLVELVRQVDAITIGALYRMSSVTAHYASQLLRSYMLRDDPMASVKAEQIATRLVKEFPAHNFVLDYHICQELGLTVEELTQTQSEAAKGIVGILEEVAGRGVICGDAGVYRGRTLKAPFIHLYDYAGGRVGGRRGSKGAQARKSKRS
jgi:hypothetical protein